MARRNIRPGRKVPERKEATLGREPERPARAQVHIPLPGGRQGQSLCGRSGVYTSKKPGVANCVHCLKKAGFIAPKGYSEPATAAAAGRFFARQQKRQSTNTDIARLKVENILLQIACAELNVDRLKAMLDTYPKTFVSQTAQRLLKTVNSRL